MADEPSFTPEPHPPAIPFSRLAREEMVTVDGREVALRTWEGEVLVRAAGLIVAARGLGLVFACLAGAVSSFPEDHRQGWLSLCACLAGAAIALLGLGLLCRAGACRLGVLLVTVVWMVLLARDVPLAFHMGRAYELQKLGTVPPLVLVLPSLFLPDLFAVFTVFRPAAEPAFRFNRLPLAPLFSAFRVHPSGRVLVAMAMVLLAILSAALCALVGPGLELTWL